MRPGVDVTQRLVNETVRSHGVQHPRNGEQGAYQAAKGDNDETSITNYTSNSSQEFIKLLQRVRTII